MSRCSGGCDQGYQAAEDNSYKAPPPHRSCVLDSCSSLKPRCLSNGSYWQAEPQTINMRRRRSGPMEWPKTAGSLETGDVTDRLSMRIPMTKRTNDLLAVVAQGWLLTIPEAAERLRVSERTIYRMIADGELEPLRFRGCTRIAASEIGESSNRIAKCRSIPLRYCCTPFTSKHS
jgi:excisionase family DNA binding protein